MTQQMETNQIFQSLFLVHEQCQFCLMQDQKKLYFGSYFTKITTNFKHVNKKYFFTQESANDPNTCNMVFLTLVDW